MDRPEVKHRVAISYIVTAVCLIAILVVSQLLWGGRTPQEPVDPADGGTVSDTDGTSEPGTQAGTDEPDERDAYEVLEAEYCTYDHYRYRMITDAEELSALGLPSAVTDDVRGGNFAAADDKIVLYAYPAYGCRAFLIANKNDAYSFCVLDGFTDDSAVQTLDTILPMYGMYAASDITSGQVVDTNGKASPLTAEELEQFYALLSGCTNAGDKAVVTDGMTIELVTRTGVILELSYYEDVSLISVLGEYYAVTDDLKTLIVNILS